MSDSKKIEDQIITSLKDLGIDDFLPENIESFDLSAQAIIEAMDLKFAELAADLLQQNAFIVSLIGLSNLLEDYIEEQLDTQGIINANLYYGIGKINSHISEIMTGAYLIRQKLEVEPSVFDIDA